MASDDGSVERAWGEGGLSYGRRRQRRLLGHRGPRPRRHCYPTQGVYWVYWGWGVLTYGISTLVNFTCFFGFNKEAD